MDEEQPSRISLIAGECGWFAAFLVAAIGATWPLARGLSRFISDLGDPLLNLWILDWDHWATLHQPLRLFDANFFYPARYALAFSENLYGIALVTFPLHLAGASHLTIYNVALILGFAFSGYGAFVLARQVTGSPLAALAAGVFFELVPFRFNHLAHLQHVWSGWLPLLIAALLAYAARPSRVRAVLFAVAFVMNGLTNVHWLLFGSTAALLLAIFLRAYRRQSVRLWIPIAVATFCGALVLLPFLVPYQRASALYGMKRNVEETEHYSATPADWMIAPPANALYGSTKLTGEPERWLFPGMLALILATAAIFLSPRAAQESVPVPGDAAPASALLRTLDAVAILLLLVATWLEGHPTASISSSFLRLGKGGDGSLPFTVAIAVVIVRFWLSLPRALGGRSLREIAATRTDAFWSAVLLCVIGFFGSLGLHGFLHRALFHVIVFRSIRAPARWAMIAYVGLAILVAMGVVAIASRARSPRAQRLLAAACVALFLFELRPRPFTWCTIVEPSPAVARWLAAQTFRGGVLELPVSTIGSREAAYLIPATVHHKALMNGTSGFDTPDHRALAAAFASEPIAPSTMTLLEQLRCAVIVVHGDDPAARSSATREWLRENLAVGRLHFVGRFDRGMRGDYAFVLPAVDAGAIRAVPTRSSLEALSRFLEADAPSYNPSAVETLDTPRPGESVSGPLRIAGWAVAPHGLREVRLHLQNDSLVVKATCGSRVDVNRYLPWYPEGCGAGFEATVAQRPTGVLQTTDVVVEVIDEDGTSKRFPPVFFRWFRGARK